MSTTNTDIKRKKLPGKITISRPSYGDGREVISIQVQDRVSKARFLEVEISYADFAQAITGLSSLDCSLIVHGLHVVGKQKITEPRSVSYPEKSHTKNEMEQWIMDTQHEEGWSIDAYLGSQGSVTAGDDGYPVLRYSVYRYEAVTV